MQLITDRPYRYYLHLEELTAATEEMQLIQQVFETQKASQLDWHALGLVAAETELSLNNGDLSEVFATYFSSFDKAKESALSFLEAFGRYNPVRLVFADLPGFATDKRRKLSEYDANQSTPFWTR